MVKVTDVCWAKTGRPGVICDYSPPRSGRAVDVPQPPVQSDFISVAYNPGRAVRMNSVTTAAVLQTRFSAEPIFTLATRDMNRLALQSLLLGAQGLGLDNVIVVAGDPFPESDIVAVSVGDFLPTELIAGITELNAGMDYRGRALRAPTDFCVGATVDLGRGIADEARLAARKVAAGAQFLITQPVFDPVDVERFDEARGGSGGDFARTPVFYGVGLMERDGISFANVPRKVRDDLAAGRSGVEIALENWQALRDGGARDCYLVPPIRRGGARNYEAAREFLERAA